LGDRASRHLSNARQHFDGQALEPSEIAVSHIIEANVAAACGDADGHATHYAAATTAIDALPDAENRTLLGATLRAIPLPPDRQRLTS